MLCFWFCGDFSNIGAVIEKSSSSGVGKIALRPVQRNRARGIELCFCFAVFSPVAESIGSLCFGSVRRGRGRSLRLFASILFPHARLCMFFALAVDCLLRLQLLDFSAECFRGFVLIVLFLKPPKSILVLFPQPAA